MPDQDKKIEREGEFDSGKETGKEKVTERKESFEDDKEGKKEIIDNSKEGSEKSAEDLEKKETIFEKINRHKEDDSSSTVVQQDDDNDSVKKQAENISKITDAEEQVRKLVDLAVKKDPFMAIKVARHLDENYVLDKLHDELVEEKTRKILLEKGLLKKS